MRYLKTYENRIYPKDIKLKKLCLYYFDGVKVLFIDWDDGDLITIDFDHKEFNRWYSLSYKPTKIKELDLEKDPEYIDMIDISIKKNDRMDYEIKKFNEWFYNLDIVETYLDSKDLGLL